MNNRCDYQLLCSCLILAVILNIIVGYKPIMSMKLKYEGNPRKFYVAQNNLGNIVGSSAQFALRLGSGAFVNGYKVKVGKSIDESYSVLRLGGLQIFESGNIPQKPESQKPIEIYEFEGCPFCRKVREAASILDLDVLYYPCPQGGLKYRLDAISEGGKKQFPYLNDPNTQTKMYESDDIIKYLFETYGGGSANIPSTLTGGFLTTLTCGLALLPRLGRGSKYQFSKPAEKPIIFWGYEASPFCKVVKERLCELEIPHIVKNCARGSSKRQELFDKTGIFQVPFIEDPNTGVNMFESADIISYLDKTYLDNPI